MGAGLDLDEPFNSLNVVNQRVEEISNTEMSDTCEDKIDASNYVSSVFFEPMTIYSYFFFDVYLQHICYREKTARKRFLQDWQDMQDMQIGT